MVEFKPAGFWRRFMSMTYEAVILFGVVFFFTYGYSALTRFQGHPGTKSLIFQVYMFTVLGCYFVYFWSAGRRSLPMKTVELMVHDMDNQPVTIKRAAVRYLAMSVMILSALALGKFAGWGWVGLAVIPVLWSIVDRRGRSLYDIVAGTQVVIVPLPPKTQRATPA